VVTKECASVDLGLRLRQVRQPGFAKADTRPV
jgi:hypothetical protein